MPSYSDSNSAYIVMVNNTIHSVTTDRNVADQISADTRNSVVQVFPIIEEYQQQLAVTEGVDTFGKFLAELPQPSDPVPTLKSLFDKKAPKKSPPADSTTYEIIQDADTTAFKVGDELAPRPTKKSK